MSKISTAPMVTVRSSVFEDGLWARSAVALLQPDVPLLDARRLGHETGTYPRLSGKETSRGPGAEKIGF